MSRSRGPENPIHRKPVCSDWLIEAIYQVVHRSHISIKEIAYRLTNEHNLPISVKSLQRFAMPDCRRPDTNGHLCLHPQWYLPLQKSAENFAILDEMERQAGRTVPANVFPIRGNLETNFHAVQRQVGLLIIESSKAIEHGLTRQAIVDLRPTIHDMRRSLDAFDHVAGHAMFGQSA